MHPTQRRPTAVKYKARIALRAPPRIITVSHPLDVKAPHANPENPPSRARPDPHDRARTHFRRTLHIRLSRGGLRKSLGE